MEKSPEAPLPIDFMSKIFLINVGANKSHTSIARSPFFPGGQFVYISFPSERKRGAACPYPPEARPYLRLSKLCQTHLDPDWRGLTYGDYLRNGRAAALRRAVPGDILLFWGLLWRNNGRNWADFTGEYGWYFIGALRIAEILDEGQTPADAKPYNIRRAAENVHFYRGVLDSGNRVFIGSKRYSALFPKAVDLQVNQNSGLLYRTVATADGERLRRNGKIRWYSATRSCRAVWDLDDSKQRARAKIARDVILRKTGYNLLLNISYDSEV